MQSGTQEEDVRNEQEVSPLRVLPLESPGPTLAASEPISVDDQRPWEEEAELNVHQAVQDDEVSEDLPTTNDGWSIALSKKARKCTQSKPYPLSNYVSYDRLSPEYNQVIQALITVSIPKNIQEAMTSPDWRAAMEEEMTALEKNGTWEMGPLPAGMKLVGSRWVFTIKYHSDGSIARYKARLVARGHTQSYGIDYNETFASMAKLNTIRVLIALAAMYDWKLYQFDVKNAFLHEELEEEVYMSLPPGYSLSKNTKGVCYLRKSIYGLK